MRARSVLGSFTLANTKWLAARMRMLVYVFCYAACIHHHNVSRWQCHMMSCWRVQERQHLYHEHAGWAELYKYEVMATYCCYGITKTSKTRLLSAAYNSQAAQC